MKKWIALAVLIVLTVYYPVPVLHIIGAFAGFAIFIFIMNIFTPHFFKAMYTAIIPAIILWMFLFAWDGDHNGAQIYQMVIEPMVNMFGRGWFAPFGALFPHWRYWLPYPDNFIDQNYSIFLNPIFVVFYTFIASLIYSCQNIRRKFTKA